MLLAGAAGHVAESLPPRPPPQARGGFWSTRGKDGAALAVDPQAGLVIGPGDLLQLEDQDGGGAALRRVALRVQRTGTQSSYLRLHVRQSAEGTYRAFVVPGPSISSSLALEVGGPGSATLASDERALPGGAPGSAPFEVALELDGPRLSLSLDGQTLVQAEDGRLTEGRCTIFADGLRVHALHVEGRDAAGHPFERDVAIADLKAEAAPRRGPLLAALARCAALALAVAGLLRALCLARPPAREWLWATTCALLPLSLLVAGRGLLGWELPAPMVALLAVLGVPPAMTALRRFVSPGSDAPRESGARAVVRSTAVALSLVAVAAWAAGAARLRAVEPLRAAEATELKAASAQGFEEPGPLRLDASNALQIPELHRSVVLRATVTLQESSWLELRLRERTGAAQGVALFLGSDARMPTGFVEEGAVTFEPIGSSSGPLPAERPLQLELRALDSRFEALVDGERVAQADERRHPVGRSVILTADGAATVSEVRLEAVPEPPVRGPEREVLAAAGAMVLLALALAAAAAPCLHVPWWRAPELAAFALVPLLPVLLGGDSSGYSPAPEFAAGAAGALGVLLLLALAHGRGARAALLVLAGAVAVPLGLSAAAGAPVSRSERAGAAWAWIGVPRLAPGLAHLQHPRLREWNYYLDAHALRGKRFAIPKPAGTVRVVCLGTSSTWGHGIDETSGLDYPSLLGDALRERMPGVPIEVVNAGVSGASTPRLLSFLREVLLGFEPDIVVFSLSYNDATFLTRFDEQGWIETLSEPGAHVGWLDRLLAARDMDRGLGDAARFQAARARFGGDSLAAWRAAVGDGPTPADRFERALHDVTDLLQSRGIAVVLVKEAQRGDEPRDWKPELYAAIDRIGESHGARVVDPKPALEAAGGNSVFMDPVHLTPRGNRAQAGAIAPVVAELIAQRRGAAGR